MRKTTSVVIPTHNRAELLRPTLECVLAQSAQPLEIIVVDDGSTDSTTDMLASYAARGVQTIRIANSKPLAARNVGLQAARGELVAFCDSDDLWQPAFLETAQRLWRHVPALQVAYSNFSIVKDGRWETTTKFDTAPGGYWNDMRRIATNLALFDGPVCDRLIEFQPFFPSCMVVNRAAFMAIGGWDEGTTGLVGCDFATALRMTEHAPTGLMLEPLVGIRKHVSNISGDPEAMNLGDAHVLEYVLRTRPSMNVFGAKLRASIATRRQDALASAFARRDRAAVQRISRLLSANERSRSVRLKAAIAALPRPIAATLNAAALWLGSAKTILLNKSSPLPAPTAWDSAAETPQQRL